MGASPTVVIVVRLAVGYGAARLTQPYNSCPYSSGSVVKNSG